MRRKGRTILVLILPDGSKSLIPAEWTDFASRTQTPRTLLAPGTATLGSLEDLLHARAIVDALLSRLPALDRENREVPATKESPIARKKSQPVRTSTPRNLPVGNATRRTQATCDRNSGTPHR
jgi:hypothetical protein